VAGVVALGPLDLHDIGAEVPQYFGGIRAGEIRPELDHLDAG
jgi:hypothetical protein